MAIMDIPYLDLPHCHVHVVSEGGEMLCVEGRCEVYESWAARSQFVEEPSGREVKEASDSHNDLYLRCGNGVR
jgi:hypothetical protein